MIGSDSGKITVQMFAVTMYIITLNYTFNVYILKLDLETVLEVFVQILLKVVQQLSGIIVTYGSRHSDFLTM